MNKETYLRRGEIYWVNLDPTVGTETKKTRPGIILSNDIANKHSKRVIIAPITSSINKLYPFEAFVMMPQGSKKAMLDQIRSIDKMRISEYICSASIENMHDLERALRLVLALS